MYPMPALPQESDGINETKTISTNTVIGVLAPCILVGVVATLIIIVAILRNQYLRTLASAFITSQSFLDLLTMAVVVPLQFYVYMFSGVGETTMCRIHQYLYHVTISLMLYHSMCLAINHCVVLVYASKCTGYSTNTTVVMSLVLCWSTNPLIWFPVLMANTQVSKEQTVTSTDHCSFWFGMYSYFTLCIAYVLPFSTTLYCYGLTFHQMRKHSRQVGSATDDASSPDHPAQNAAMQLAKASQIIFLISLVSALPYTILSSLARLQVFSEAPTLGLVVTSMVFTAGCAIRPFVYVAFSDNYRSAVKNMFCRRRNIRVPKITIQRPTAGHIETPSETVSASSSQENLCPTNNAMFENTITNTVSSEV